MIKLRLANINDCVQILNIYQYYVLNTAITFEYEVPSLSEMENRMTNILSKYPYLVALIDDTIFGYAYASDFRYRAAYQWSPESSIYIDANHKGKGIGKLLYQKLFDILKLQGYYNVFAGAALPNEASVAIHLNCGFKEIGIFKNIGYKFDKWHSTKWFQLILNDHKIHPITPKTIAEIDNISL